MGQQGLGTTLLEFWSRFVIVLPLLSDNYSDHEAPDEGSSVLASVGTPKSD